MDIQTAAALEQTVGEATKIKQQIHQMDMDSLIDEKVEIADQNKNYTFNVQYRKYANDEMNAKGKYIGILERILIAFFIVGNAYQGLILLGTIKTVTRFKQFDDKSFAEYYLIGTFFSILLGLTFGLVIQRVL